jgi:signal transduction histidine kinase
MRLSLGLRVLLLVTLVNAGVFGAGLTFLVGQIASEREEQSGRFGELLLYTLQGTINPEGELKVASILEWPWWGEFSDAILVDQKLGRTGADELVARGVHLNPVGAAHRSASFDHASVLGSISSSMETKTRVTAAEGVAIPIYDTSGGVWGGCWFQLPAGAGTRELAQGLLPWFLGSTLLLSLVTFWVLRRNVLRPVEDLAAASARLSGGELDVRLDTPSHADEIGDLVRGFNEMAGEVARARAHLEDVAADERRKARTAEEAAMTQRRLAAMGELAAGIAHEINNPLGGMRNAVESLERGDIEPDRRARYLELVDGGLSRIQGIVGKLLRFTPRRDLSEQIFSYADAARDAVALIEHRASAEGVELVVELDGIGESYVRGDQSEIGQAALNLLQNALDALEEGCQGDSPRVVVDLKRDGEEQRLRIRDNGPGVEAERLGRLTDLFHTSKDVGRGTGLGLPLALHVASAHGGRLLLSSPPGEGFHAELCLPVAEETS